MLDSLFVETISRAISDYRQILKKYLTPADRSAKIALLRLKDPTIFDNEPELYQVVQNILHDIEQNISVPNEGYYSYYGIVRFSKFLREYIDNYIIDGNKVIHKTQKAANLLIKSIQLMNLPSDQLNEGIAEQVISSHPLIISYSSKEQLAIYNSTLERLSERNKAFYRQIVHDFRVRLGETLAEAA